MPAQQQQWRQMPRGKYSSASWFPTFKVEEILMRQAIFRFVKCIWLPESLPCS
jgi:hypothetical protein